jgi:divalent metal cation (Fe/Co/Zn/Cd) transporter
MMLRDTLLRRAVRLEIGTIAWTTIEAGVAIIAGIAAGSLALTGFGFDSLIELFSAGLVLRRLRAQLAGSNTEEDEGRERRALRAIAVSFWVLAAYLVIDGTVSLISGSGPEHSLVGIALSAAALVIMPGLAWSKRRLGQLLDSQLLLADAAETGFCAWLALSALLGLVLSGTVGWTWADPVAGLVIAAFAIYEGREAWEGELIEDDD